MTIHIYGMHNHFFWLKYAYTLFFFSTICQWGNSQIDNTWAEVIEQAVDSCQKAKLIDQYISDVIWREDFSKELKNRINQNISLCEKVDCGEQLLWAKARKIDVALNEGKLETVFEEIQVLFRSPILQDTKLRAYLYELIGMYYLVTGEINPQGNSFVKAIYLLEKNVPKNRKLGQNYEYLASCYNHLSKNDSAIFFSKKALHFYENRKDSVKIINTLLSQNVFYMAAGDTQKAFEKLLEAQTVSQNFSAAHKVKNEVLISLGLSYESHKDFSKALIIAEEGIQNLEKIKKTAGDFSKTDLWNFYLMKGRILMNTQRIEEGLAYITKSIVLCNEENLFPTLLITSSLFEISAFLKLKNYELSASRLADILYSLQANQGQEIFNIKILKLANELYLHSQLRPTPKFQEALEPVIYRVIEKNEGLYNDNKLVAYQLLALLQVFDGDTDELLVSFKTINALKDSIWSQQKNEAVSKLLVEYESKEQQQQIAIQKNELEKRTMERNTLIGFSMGLLLIGTLLVLYFRQRRQNVTALENKIAFRTKELEATNKKLLHSNEELERFAYISSHDLKEPLRNILSFIGLIKRKGLENNKDTQTYFNYIKENANQMYRLVEDVLEFSKLKKTTLKKQKTDLTKTVNNATDAIAEYISQNNARIQVNSMPIIHTDGTMLFLVFKNLIENAIKYNKNESPLIQISHKEDEAFHYFSVKDDGIGIESDYKQQIFEMFKRLHSKEQYEGSGIGLAICKRIVEYFDGQISLESDFGKGSVFTFSISKKNDSLDDKQV